jgi:hypothetical protein
MFQGINTATTRAGVPDAQMFWCDGFIPLSPRNLRVLPGIGSALYTGGANTIVCFYFYNLGATPYMVVFKTDGSATQVRTTDGATTTILPAMSIGAPSITTIGVAQYGSQYLLIATSKPSNPASGYWVWDGKQLFGAGSLAPTVTLTNPGAAYVSAPTVVISGGSGTGATASAAVSNGVVTNVVITNPGSGYLASDLPTVTLVGGQQTGSGASLTAVLSAIPSGMNGSLTANWNHAIYGPGTWVDQLASITIANAGTGYSSATTAHWTTGPFPGFWSPSGPPTINLTISGGMITAVSFTPDPHNPNALFNNQNNGDPAIVVSDPASGQYTVTSVTGTPTGMNYSPSTTITASGGGSPVTQATFTPVITSGQITGVNIINGGVYGSNTPPTLAVTDTAVTATAKIGLMPFGVTGNAIETYAGHVWVANGPLVQFSAPGVVDNFSTASGGGSFTSSDSFLRVGYTRLIQTNGFLFLIGDSSMNYISGVQTTTPSGGSPTTTFTNNNSDPETGTPYPASVTTIGQDIFIANQNGVYVSTGGTFVKKSEPLDGVYNTAPGIFNGMQLSAAKTLIFGKLVWMVLVPIIDPVLKTQRTKLFMFNERFWWSSEQDVTLTFIQAQEINSVFTAWGTDGTHIYPLFNTKSTAFTKRMQSRLWDSPQGYDYTKSSVNLFGVAQFLGASNLSYNVFIDNEAGFSNRAGPYTHSGTTADQEVFSVMPPYAIGQMGVVTGMTVETTADDLVIVSVMMQDEIVGYRA